MNIRPERSLADRSSGRLRRQLLRNSLALGGATLASVAYLDGLLGERRWPSNENLLVGANANAEELSLACSGLGLADAREDAGYVQKVLPGVSAYFRYSNDGFSIGELAGLLAAAAPQARTVHLYGQSLGGPVGLETQRRSGIPGLELGRIIVNCSPFDLDDARLGEYAKIMQAVRWPVGPASKYGFSIVRGLIERQSPQELFRQAKSNAFGGGSPRLWLVQLGVMKGIDLAGGLGSYRPLVGPQTALYYCRPQDPARDTVVDTLSASAKFADFSEKLDIPFRDIAIPEVGHAQTQQTFDYLISSSALA